MTNRQDPSPAERRSNHELRQVIEDMLDRIRDFRRLANEWTPAERARAERELELLMVRLRETALRSE